MNDFDNFNKEVKKSKKREAIELLVTLLVMLFIFKFILMSVRVNGSSMNPTYTNGDRGIMVRKNPINKPKHGSVVVIKTTIEGVEEQIVKRVFALENETIEIKNNEIFVNGNKVSDNTRSKDTQMEDYPLTTLKENEIFVLGDNRNNSLDSSELGPFKISEVQAIGGITYWPVDNIGLMN